jgi:hypothetical protein
MGGIKNLLDPSGQVKKDVEMTPGVIARLLALGQGRAYRQCYG